MAVIHNNALVNGLSGTISGLVFRQVRGKTILSCKPSKPTKQSALQKENRSRFKRASAYAKTMMLNADKKAYYKRKAIKLKLPNAYTAAICDYMRKPEIEKIDASNHANNTKNVICLRVKKKDFTVPRVRVVLRNASGQVVESGDAIQSKNDVFIYKALTTSLTGISLSVQSCLMEYQRDYYQDLVIS